MVAVVLNNNKALDLLQLQLQQKNGINTGQATAQHACIFVDKKLMLGKNAMPAKAGCYSPNHDIVYLALKAGDNKKQRGYQCKNANKQ